MSTMKRVSLNERFEIRAGVEDVCGFLASSDTIMVWAGALYRTLNPEADPDQQDAEPLTIHAECPARVVVEGSIGPFAMLVAFTMAEGPASTAVDVSVELQPAGISGVVAPVEDSAVRECVASGMEEVRRRLQG